MKTFNQWLVENKNIDENWRNWLAGGLAAVSPMAAHASDAADFLPSKSERPVAQYVSSNPASKFIPKVGDKTIAHPYSFLSRQKGGYDEVPDWEAARINLTNHGKTYLKPEHEKIFQQRLK